MHVAVDRVTGGAAKGLLFKNRVLTNSRGYQPTFQFRLQINQPLESELRWLVQALLALHLGILRIGSSRRREDWNSPRHPSRVVNINSSLMRYS